MVELFVPVDLKCKLRKLLTIGIISRSVDVAMRIEGLFFNGLVRGEQCRSRNLIGGGGRRPAPRVRAALIASRNIETMTKLRIASPSSLHFSLFYLKFTYRASRLLFRQLNHLDRYDNKYKS